MSATLFPLDEAQVAELRRHIVGALSGRVPPQYVDEIADLAIHAARQSIETIQRTIRSASDDRVAMAALSPAVSIVASLCSSIEVGVRDFARERGMAHFEAKVSL